MDASTFYLVSHAAIGAALGFRSPAKGLALLLAFVATTASLPWHLGLGDLPTTSAYLLGLLAAATISKLAQDRNLAAPGNTDNLLRPFPAITCLLFVTAAGPTVLAIVRAYGPSNVIGQFHFTFIALSGPAALLLSTQCLRRERDRELVRLAFFCGLAIAVLSPVLQLLLSIHPWARPDLDVADGFWLSGFFHDPHSYAAYLSLGIGLALGAAIGWSKRGDRLLVAAALSLAGAAFVVLLYTSSRSGLLTAAITVVALIAIESGTGSGAAKSGLPRWARLTISMVLLSTIVVSTLVLLVPSVREASYNELVKLGNPRMWSLLQPDTRITDERSFYVRRGLWQKAGMLIRERPIWGLGPNEFARTEVPVAQPDGTPIPAELLLQNTHNYYLQLGAEYGLPAMFAFVALVALTLATIARAAWRCTEPLQRGILSGIAAGQIGFLTFSLVSHPLLLAEMQAVYWSLAGLGVATAVYSPDVQSVGSTSHPKPNPE